MSNMFRNTGITYFQTPHSFIAEDIFRNITKTGLLLYTFLISRVERNTKLTLKFSNKELSEQTWMAASQIILARECLLKLGLIMVEKVDGGAYEYTLCNPDTGEAVPNMRPRTLGFDFSTCSHPEG